MASEFDRLQAALPKRYTLLRELDRGGMSRVYLARESLPDRDVAIKVFDHILSAQLGRERFVREVELTSQLGHPHIVPIYAAGEAGGELYYVMPFIGGESLRDRLEREGRLPIDDALRITEQVAGALAHAHEKGIVHRDVKPANILFQSGHAVVADFGIARALFSLEDPDGGTLTGAGTSLGTPDYMSPEQIGGTGEAIGPHTDQYGLACVLYEMLGGQPPFHSRTAQATLARQLTDGMPSLRALRKTVSPAVEAAIGKALEKTPVDRFGSVAEFAYALVQASPSVIPTGGAAPERTRDIGAAGLWWRLAGVAVAVAAVGFAWNAWSGGAPAMAVVESAYRDSVAVLPLDDRTGDPRFQFLGLSMADAITGHLQKVGALKVIAPVTAEYRWEQNLGFTLVFDSLGVAHVLEGYFELAGGNDLSITVRDLDRGGTVHYQEAYTLDADSRDTEVAAIAYRVAERFVEGAGLNVRLAADDVGFGPGRDAYVNGTRSMGRRTPEGIREAVASFSQSIALDDAYAPAHSGLANAYTLAMFYRYDVGPDSYEMAGRSLAASERAIELNPDHEDGYSSRGFTLALIGMDLDDAEADFERALELAPNESDGASWSGRIHEERGRFDDAFRALQRARDLDDANPARRIGLAGLAFRQGNYAVAIEESRQALALQPTLTWATALLGWSLALSGRGEECLSLDFGVYDLVRAVCLHSIGRRQEAAGMARLAAASFPPGADDPDYLDAEVTAQGLVAYFGYAGDAAVAAEWLRRAYELTPFVEGRMLGSALIDPVDDDRTFLSALEQARSTAQARVRDEWMRVGDDRPRLGPRR